MSTTQPARGMRDFLPDEVRRREHVIGVIANIYERYGFEPLETPAVENIDTLMGKYGEEGDQLIFKILKRGDRDGGPIADLALRYDLTVPLARVVAEYRGKLPRFFKRYQIQPVWRADRPQRGRFREFYQCDVDAIGSRSTIVETEICAAASEALATLGFDDFTIRLNHRQVLSGLLDVAGVAPSKHGEALVALDKLDKIGTDGVERELLERGLAADAVAALLGAFLDAGAQGHRNTGAEGQSGRGAEEHGAPGLQPRGYPLDRLEQRLAGHEAGAAGVRTLREILARVEHTAAAGRLRIDPTLARGLSYYTGAIMEIAVADLAGSLGGGGRYDNLVGMFLGEDVPACGFSLGLERIIVVMTERGMFPPRLQGTPADVMVTVFNREGVGASLDLARELRAAGLRVDVYPEVDKVGKQFKYASGRGVPLVAVLGDDELARGEVGLKDMRSGEQVAVPRVQVAASVRARLAGGKP